MSGMNDDRSLAVGEEPVEVLHPHWKTLVRPVGLAVVLVAVALAGEVLIPAGKSAAVERLALAVVVIVLLMWGLMYPLLVWRTTRYELTTKRLRLRTGVIARNGRDIPLSRITDVSFRKTVLDRILGCGTLVVESAGEHGETPLREIPHVERVSARLFQLVEDERLRAVQNPQGDGRGDRPDAWLPAQAARQPVSGAVGPRAARSALGRRVSRKRRGRPSGAVVSSRAAWSAWQRCGAGERHSNHAKHERDRQRPAAVTVEQAAG